MKKKSITIVFSIIIAILLIVGLYPRTYYYHGEISNQTVNLLNGECLTDTCLPGVWKPKGLIIPLYRFHINYLQHKWMMSISNIREYQSCLRMINCDELDEKMKKEYGKWVKF